MMKSRLMLCVVLLLCASRASAQTVGRDGTCTSGSGTSTDITWNHVVGAANAFGALILLDGPGGTNPTAVTIGGSNFTQATGSPLNPGGGARFGRAYYINNPPTGTVAVHYINDGSGSVFAELCTWSASQIENQGTPVTTTASSPATATVSSTDPGAWTVYGVTDNSGSQAASTGSTLFGANGTAAVWYDSNGTVASGSHNMSVTSNSGGVQYAFIFSIAPSGGGGGASPCDRARRGFGCVEDALAQGRGR